MSRAHRKPRGSSFWDGLIQQGDCWIWPWAGASQNAAYGVVRINGKTMPAHRYAYEEMVGEIPVGLHLDHLCRVTRCVNPYHLDPVTPAVNSKRAGAARTHCSQGHEFTEESTYIRKDRPGVRQCRTCSIERSRARREAA